MENSCSEKDSSDKTKNELLLVDSRATSGLILARAAKKAEEIAMRQAKKY